jgi:hypothetical protein
VSPASHCSRPGVPDAACSPAGVTPQFLPAVKRTARAVTGRPRRSPRHAKSGGLQTVASPPLFGLARPGASGRSLSRPAAPNAGLIGRAVNLGGESCRETVCKKKRWEARGPVRSEVSLPPPTPPSREFLELPRRGFCSVSSSGQEAPRGQAVTGRPRKAPELRKDRYRRSPGEPGVQAAPCGFPSTDRGVTTGPRAAETTLAVAADAPRGARIDRDREFGHDDGYGSFRHSSPSSSRSRNSFLVRGITFFG